MFKSHPADGFLLALNKSIIIKLFDNNINMKKKVIINYPILVFLIINILSFLLMLYFYKNDFSNFIIFKTIIFIGLLWIPYLVGKIIKTQIPKIIYILYFFIIFADLLLGKIMMFERFTSLYNYIVLFIQGIIFYIFGLWVIKFLDDYGFLNYNLINVFSAIFAFCLTTLKEVFFYLVRSSFKLEQIDHMRDILIAFLGIVSIFILFIIDNKYYKHKYYMMIDSEFEKKM